MIAEALPKRRRRINQRSVLKSNVESIPTKKVSDDRNVCVLYTNFTSEGDYINDHDYLINPYVRNKMYYHHGPVPVCVCLLCDLVHQAADHVDHMKSHKTICQICQIDFHNVFILNLHVRCHASYCSECKVTISYVDQIPHAQMHNRSLSLSNIDIPDEVIQRYLNKPEETTSQPEKEKEPPPSSAPYKTLKQLLDEPIEDLRSRLDNSNSSSTNSNLRRSRRLTRSRKQDIEDSNQDEEEACIYDKTTKSFITPTVEKQQKLLKKCNSDKEKSEPDKQAEKAKVILNDSNNSESKESDNVNTLLCEESMEDDKEIDTSNITLTSTEKESPVQSNNVPTQSATAEMKSKKNSITKKRRRKTFLSIPKKGFSRGTKQKQSNIKLPKSTDIENLKTDDKPSKPNISEVKNDLQEIDDVKELKKREESDTRKIEETPSSSREKRLTRRQLADSNKSESSQNEGGNLGKICDNKSSRKRKRDTVSQVLEDATVGSIEANEFPATKERTETKIKSFSDKSPELFKNNSITTPTESDEPKTDKIGSESPLKIESENVSKNLLNATSEVNTNNSASNEVVSLENLPEGSETSRNSTKPSPVRGDLKMRIKSIKYNPFVLLSNVSKQRPRVKLNVVETKPEKNLKTYGRANKNRKMITDDSETFSEIAEKSSPSPKELETTIDSTQVKESSDVTVEKKDQTKIQTDVAVNTNLEKTNKGSKKDWRLNPLTNNSKARSSRSRGSLGLVEGLRGSEKRHRASKKFKNNTLDGPSVDLDTSDSKNVAENESLKVKNVEPDKASVINLDIPQSKNSDLSETNTESTGLKTDSTGIKAASTETNTEPTDTNAEPEEPIVTNAESTETKTKPTGIKAASTEKNTKPTDTNAELEEPIVTNAESTETKTEPTGLKTDPTRTKAASIETNTNPADTNSEPDRNTELTDTNIEPNGTSLVDSPTV